MRRPFSKDPKVEKSLNHSVRDAVAWSVMSGAGESYFSAFALFLKATTTQIAWLASIPPLLAALAQLGSVWLGRIVGRRKSIIVFGATAQCVFWLPMLVLPWLFPEYAVPIFIALVVMHQACGNLVSPQWSSLMGDLVPQRKRGRYFGLRTRYATVASFAALLLAGVVLHEFDAGGATWIGFALIFIVAAGARMVSVYHLRHMHEPPRAAEKLSPALDWKAWTRRFKRSPAVRFSLAHGCMQAAVSMAAPFFTVYMLRDLHFTYLEFTAVTATSVLFHFAALQTWGRICDAYGSRIVLVCTGTLITLFPSLWLVSTSFWFIIGVQMISGMSWSGFSLATTNYLFDSVPAEKRSQYMAFHNILTAVGASVGAIAGGALLVIVPTEFNIAGWHVSWFTALYGVFLASSICRIAVAAVFLPRLQEVREVRAAPAHEFAWRLVRGLANRVRHRVVFAVVAVKRRVAMLIPERV